MQGPVSGRRIKRSTIRNSIIIAIVLVTLLVILLGGNFLLTQYTVSKQEAEKTRNESRALEYATAVAKPLHSDLQGYTKIASRADLIEAFQSADTDALAGFAEGIAAESDSILKARLFLPGKYRIDRESVPPLGYASLDLLKKAERGKAPLQLEAHGFGGRAPHLVFITRVKDAEDKLLGLLHLSLSPDKYIQLKKRIDVQQGYIELTQVGGRKPLVLKKLGNEQQRAGTPTVVDIEKTRWELRYWPEGSASAVTASSGGMMRYLFTLILVLMIVAMIYLRKQRQSGDVDTGASGVLQSVLGKFRQQKSDHGLDSTAEIPAAVPQRPAQEREAAAPAAQVDTERTTEPAPATAGTTAQAATPAAPSKPQEAAPQPAEISAVIFRAYDIRGVVDKALTAGIVEIIGKAIGSEASARGQKTLVVGRDGRASSEEFSSALIKGLRATGTDVVDIGQVPTPVLYFATHHLETASGVMVTGSHNGPEYNGLKIVLGEESLHGEAIQSLRKRIDEGDFTSGMGSLQAADIVADYIRRATEDIPVALGGAFKLVVDCGNGVAGLVAPQLYRALGHEVEELYCEVDGSFPNHHPDPSQTENLSALIDKVKATQADLGFAFDGDGDRLGVVDGNGEIIWPDRQLMLFARDVLTRNEGKPIIYDVKCSRYLKAIIEMSGGKPLMWKTGHSLIKEKMKQEDAPLAGEMSGHIFFKERWYGFDDALYAGARMLEILANNKSSKPTEVFADLPGGVTTPELRIPLAEKHHKKFMQVFKSKIKFADAEVIDIDGIRIDFPDRWGLLRPSNTSPCLVARFEAEDENTLEKVKSEFRDLINAVTPDLKVPF